MPVQFEIVLKDDPSNASRAPAGGGAGAGYSQDDIIEAARRRIQSQEKQREVASMVEKFRTATGGGPSPFDAMGEARKRLESQDRNAAVKAAMASLRPGPPEESGGGGIGAGLNALRSGAGQIAGSGMFGSGVAALAPILSAAAPVALFVAAVGAFKFAVSHFVARGEELARFSPEITMARANADVATIFREMREAEALGPNIAKLTKAKSKFDDQWSTFITPIEKTVVGGLALMLEDINKEGNPIAWAWKNFSAAGLQVKGWEFLAEKLGIKEAKKGKSEEEEAKEAEQMLDRLWGSLVDDFEVGVGKRDALADQAEQKRNAPVLEL